MKGYKTVVFNGIMLVAGITGASVTDVAAEQAAAGVVAVIAVVNIILRAITSSPIFSKAK